MRVKLVKKAFERYSTYQSVPMEYPVLAPVSILPPVQWLFQIPPLLDQDPVVVPMSPNPVLAWFVHPLAISQWLELAVLSLQTIFVR